MPRDNRHSERYEANRGRGRDEGRDSVEAAGRDRGYGSREHGGRGRGEHERDYNRRNERDEGRRGGHGGREERRQAERHSREERSAREERSYNRDGREQHGRRGADRPKNRAERRAELFGTVKNNDDFENDDWTGDPLARRVEVACPVAKRCGGCEWLAMPYDEQLRRKQEYIEELFSSYSCEVEPIIGMDDPWGYRNKVQLPFAPGYPDKDGRTPARWGIFERGTHNIVPCRRCLVEDERARPIIATVAELLPRFNIKPYDEKTGEGLLRYTLVRTAHTTGQVMVTFVCNGSRIPASNAFLDRLLEKHPEITTVVLNINRERTSVILGKEEKILMGPGYIEDELCGCRFRISSSSFYQTNPVAAESLYSLAVKMAALKPSDVIGDAYCGTGTIGIVAAKQSGASLLGVERNGDAVVDARENAELNNVENAEFITGDAGSVFARMARAGESLDVVFMDPPRAGSSQAFLANLSRLGPRRVVYISCEPRTQLHDIEALVRNGYQVKRIRPVDMFPHTDHVENVVVLERKQHPDRMGKRHVPKAWAHERSDEAPVDASADGDAWDEYDE